MTRWIFIFLLPGLAFAEKISPEKIEFFEKRIRPILAQDCYECHRTGGKKKGGLALDHRAAMAEGGDSDDLFDFANPKESYLIKILRHEEEGMEMPKDGAKLSDQIVADFVKWIAMGAPDPRDEPPSDEEVAEDQNWDKVMARRKQWWSFQPIRKVPPPEGEGSFIDRFVDQKITEAGLEKVEKAEDRDLIRRLSFALRGVPPSIEEVTTYLADNRSDRQEHLVDAFLESSQFGERWARHWMDWIRYADSHGSEGDPNIKNAWRYRDYLIRALNKNVPYDTLVTEHLAGDLLEKPRIQDDRNESALGTAHLRMVFHGFAPTDALDEKVRFTDDQINVVTKAFQGLTVSCARCHNHKFDAISQEDYYALFGIFGSTKPGVVRVDAVDEKATRAEMKILKSEIKKSLVNHWLVEEKIWGKRFFENPDGHKKDDLIFLRAWDEGRKDMTAYLLNIPEKKKAENQSRWVGEELQAWVTHGTGLSESGTFSIAPEGESSLTGIYPSGIYTHQTSDKDRGIALSPRIELAGNEEVWMKVRGRGKSVVRYSVQNYPRNGTVFPSSDLTKGKWRWIRHDLNYWEGDRIHLELSTAQDQPILAKNDERSWFGISSAYVAQKGGGHPSDLELHEMKKFLKSAHRSEESLPEFFQRVVLESLTAWASGKMIDQQAIILDELLQIGILPNDASIAGESLKEYRALEKSLAVPVRAPGVWEADPHDQEFYLRGDHKKPAHLVKRRFLEAIDKEPYRTEQSGRLELAQDFLRADNPFTARVFVNRVWHHLFGNGLVRTTDNFGRLGEKPSHPELLDYLAASFVEDEWDIKKLIRRIVLTEAWQRSSAPGSRAKEKDPDNRLLSHFNLRRLDAEAIRDALITVSGSLDSKMFGNTVDGKSRRRSVYVRTQRNRLDPFLQTFNQPVPLGGKGRRDETNVPAQSLTLLNSQWVIDLARQFSEKLKGETLEEKASHAYELAFSRKPHPEELRKVLTFMEDMNREREISETRRRKLSNQIREAEKKVATLMAAAKPIEADVSKSPAPIAHWDFEKDDHKGTLHGGAVVKGGKLITGHDGGYFTSKPLDQDLGEKTLQVLVQLDQLTQRGGGAMGVETLDGNIFDSIVFGENVPGEWMAGSEFLNRTLGSGGPIETEPHQKAVWITITYAEDGMIQIYRNGARYGRSYRKAALKKFQKGAARVIMGNRHGSPAANRLLQGAIEKARLFNRALSPQEVGHSIGREVAPSREEILENFTAEEKAVLLNAEAHLDNLRAQLDESNRGSNPSTPLADLAHALFNSKEMIYVR